MSNNSVSYDSVMKTASKTRKETKRVTHKKLVDSAIKNFRKNGFVGTKTLDIARTAGVSHGTVFLHFKTKNDLFAEVLGEFGRQATYRMRELTDSGMGVYEVLNAHLKVLAEYEDIYYRMISEQSNLPDEVELVIISIQSAISQTLNIAIQKEVKSGKIKNMPMDLLFNTWIGLLHHYFAHRHLFCPDGSLIENKGKKLLNHFISLIKLERS